MDTSQYTSDLIVRFWLKVNKNGSTPKHAPELGNCWEWIAGKIHTGYGQFRVGKKLELAHRVSWQIASGEIPTQLFVLHKCDNPAYVNPNHLFLGTHQENMNDMKIKKRKSRKSVNNGELHGRHKLTLAQVDEIRKRSKETGINAKSLAIEYQISVSHLRRILTGKYWKALC